jgi:hypothetical protein
LFFVVFRFTTDEFFLCFVWRIRDGVALTVHVFLFIQLEGERCRMGNNRRSWKSIIRQLFF